MSRDRTALAALDLATARAAELALELDAMTAERDTLRSENVRLTIREKDLVTRLLTAERELREMTLAAGERGLKALGELERKLAADEKKGRPS